MALNRIVNLSIGVDGTGLLLSQLDIDFNIEKNTNVSANFAEFTIYNAKESTRKNVLKKGNNLIFELGYDDEAVAVVFIGNIIESFSEKIGPDWVTKIKAYTIRSKTDALQVATVSLSYTANTPVSSPLNAIAQSYGLIVSGLSNISSLKLPNGWTYAGTFNGAIRYIKGILENKNFGLYIDNNEILIYKIGEAARYKVIILSYDGGLISVRDISKTEEQKKRIEFKSIIIPQVRINGAIVVTGTPLNDGTYIVDKLKISGNNYGGDFNIVGEAVA